MEKTVCELFAGVGGFRCGLNNIKKLNDIKNPETWNTVWYNQWEPDKKMQWAHDCYVDKFGISLDLSGKDTTNIDISKVNKNDIPNHNLLVGGFPCQDYSVARSLSGEQGIEGKKGVLWWSILDTIKAKHPPFILLENVDRLLKSPSKQRGRDFGIILGCLNNEGYFVEWRVINAAEYGGVQRRRRTFIFAYHKTTVFAHSITPNISNPQKIINSDGFFARTFPISHISEKDIKVYNNLSKDIAKISSNFKFTFENSGFLINNSIYTVRTKPKSICYLTLGSILENNPVDDRYFIPDNQLYYTSHNITHSDERETELSSDDRHTWQYLKGAKKRNRTNKEGNKYVFSEGAIPLIDKWAAPARTMLTSEGTFNRSTHIVEDKTTHNIRKLTPVETERIQGFPDNWTQFCLVNGERKPMPERNRYFCMGNALVVPLISKMGHYLEEIFNNEEENEEHPIDE